jgi:hypothetical protein
MTDVAPDNRLAPKRPLNLSALFFKHVAVFNVLGLVLVLAGCGAYIAQINGSVTTGYALRDAQTKVDELTNENQKLEVAVRKEQSLEDVENSVKILGLVPAGTPTYVSAASASYALAK